MLNYRFMVAAVAALCVLLAAGSALALSFGDVVISESYGSGSNSALCIIDFGPKSYAFHYSFNGAVTGLSMVLDLDTPHTGLDVSYTDFGGSLGIFIDDFAYLSQTKRITTGVYPGWNYWTSADGVNWVSSSVGAGQRGLQNGSWDAWSYTGFDSETWQPCDPAPVTPVPEPSSAAALLGFMGLLPAVKSRRNK